MSDNKPKTPEQIAIDLAIKGLEVAGAAAISAVGAIVTHRVTERNSRKKAREIAVEENNKEAE